jgi:hypothetical protein
MSSLVQAVALLPQNAQFHARLAELDPGRSSEIDRALVLNPRNASWWIMRSVRREEAGDLPGAEASLRSAVNIARYYVPLWSLTAFYYREGNTAGFIHSANDTLSVGTGDPRSVFQMAARLGLPAHVVQNQILPAQADILMAYLKHALETGDWLSATETGIHLAAVGSKDDTPALLTASERLFLSGNLNEAVIVRNSAVSAHWISMTRMNPASGVSLNDGTFAQPRIYLGFDWKAPAEVAVAFSPGRYAKLAFNGEEPEQCDLLSQYLPVLPGRHYKLITRYRTEDLPSASCIGVFCRKTDHAKNGLFGLFDQEELAIGKS